MTIKNVLKMGQSFLFQRAKEVEDFSKPDLHDLIKDMRDTMLDRKGVGIAAPQIGSDKRVIMYGFENNPRYPNETPVPFTILINPIIYPFTKTKMDGLEGCLSVPGLRGVVPRFEKIHYEGFDQNGKKIAGIAEGFHARILQHECDHLDGVLFPMRVVDMKKFGFEDVLAL